MQVQSLGWEDSLEEEMATHFSILAWRIPMDRGACQATVHRVAKYRIRLKWLNTHKSSECFCSLDSASNTETGIIIQIGNIILHPFCFCFYFPSHPIPWFFSLSVVSYSFETLWTAVHQSPLFIGFSRQEYWSGLPFPFPGNLPHPGIKPESPALQMYSFTAESLGGSKWKCCSILFNSFETPWTVVHQAPLSMEFCNQEYWTGLPFPSPEEFPYPGVELKSSALQTDSLLSELPISCPEVKE